MTCLRAEIKIRRAANRARARASPEADRRLTKIVPGARFPSPRFLHGGSIRGSL